jgi:hypothetical protein
MMLTLDAKGFQQLSKACDKLLEQAEKIEAQAAERLAKKPQQDGIIETGLGVMQFEAARLSGSVDGDKPAVRRRARSRRAATK